MRKRCTSCVGDARARRGARHTAAARVQARGAAAGRVRRPPRWDHASNCAGAAAQSRHRRACAADCAGHGLWRVAGLCETSDFPTRLPNSLAQGKRPRPGPVRRLPCSCVRRAASSERSRSRWTARVAAKRADCERTLPLCPGDGGLGSLFRSVGFEIFSDELRQDMEASLQLQLSNSCRILAQPHELRETLRLRRAACPLRPALRGRHSRAEVLLVGTVNHSVRHPLC